MLVKERLIERFRGRKVKSTGDGVLAVFDGPDVPCGAPSPYATGSAG
jgi:class 3 adenylate cyclase